MIYLILIVVFIIFVTVIMSLNRDDLLPHTADEYLSPTPLDILFETIDSTPDTPVGFGYKMSWLAIKSSDAHAVVETLVIDHLQPANWQTGITAAYHGHTFISPPVHGWVLVASYHLPELGNDAEPQRFTPLLAGLSQKFGEVQYFGTQRVVGYHAWSRFLNGTETRAFAYLGERGEILADRGEKTDAEIQLGYEYFDPDSPDADSDAHWEREDLCYPDEEHVMEIAGLWGVNPSHLEEQKLPESAGWIGKLGAVPHKQSSDNTTSPTAE
ncbi:hypothetical protein [uncultured Gimesia sp.]|jgi:hypothetical protein|uniref:hypothetical protein n=1 Tax=uncultured Gimesia sp. TaxID=1678688 RepID=UPI0026297DEB|nr:hypothetical protein [uncultured Gimesia sp.]